ncbi:MAG: transcription elongation factor GreA [Endomicrobiales bacterium]|jgi:transcription elongation factor GreA
MSSIYLTKDGRNKMLKELENLKDRKPLVQEEIARAREHGDLRENAEYHAAKETLTNIQRRIAELETKLTRVQIIDDEMLGTDNIFIGVTTKIKDTDGDVYDYTIVDIEEANLNEGKISVQSPLAQGLLGHKVGETVKIKLPAGEMEFEIMKISR